MCGGLIGLIIGLVLGLVLGLVTGIDSVIINFLYMLNIGLFIEYILILHIILTINF
jgi:hypothetical protein